MKLIILDRDGVINHDRDDFVKSKDEWVPIAGSLEAIARLSNAGYHVVVATNQSGLARGYFDFDALNAMHRKMHELTAAAGGRIDAVFFCPHAAAANCDCRKPKPGLFEAIRSRYGLHSLKGIPTVGDSLRDLEAGAATGCVPHLVLTGKGQKTQSQTLPEGTRIHADLSACVRQILER
jgi:D-glycero-D-manno-heptose 1,7-bisphosphate phosphatase